MDASAPTPQKQIRIAVAAADNAAHNTFYLTVSLWAYVNAVM